MARRLLAREKIRLKVSIPAELRESLREAFDLIQQSRNDPDIVLGHDDAIQVGAVCGGRYGKKTRPYVLTYYPEGDTEKGRWFLSLHHTEIEDIGYGRMLDILMYCCQSPDCRCKFREADEHCFYCDYTEGPDFRQFDFPEASERLKQRSLDGISESSTRDDVVARLGPPDNAGGNLMSPLGYVYPWITYRREDCQIRFEFGNNQRIRNVTIMERKWEP